MPLKNKLKHATMAMFQITGHAVASLMRVGLIGSSAVAALLGQFALAAVLAILALGVWLRFWRGNVRGK